MASTNKTKNLQLSQFLGSDKPAWLTDYNGDMEKIDNGFGNIINDQTSLDHSVETLTTAVGNLETVDQSLQQQITKNATELVVQGGTIETMNHKVTLNQENIGQLTTTVGQHTVELNEVDTRLDALEAGQGSEVTKAYVDTEVGKVATNLSQTNTNLSGQIATVQKGASGISLTLAQDIPNALKFTNYDGADTVIPFSGGAKAYVFESQLSNRPTGTYTYDVSKIDGYQNSTVENFFLVLSGGETYLKLTCGTGSNPPTSTSKYTIPVCTYDNNTGIMTLTGLVGNGNLWTGFNAWTVVYIPNITIEKYDPN